MQSLLFCRDSFSSRISSLILTKFIPAITGGIYVNPDERYLLSLPAKYGGLGLPIFSELADIEF